jgi:hypothetical protein
MGGFYSLTYAHNYIIGNIAEEQQAFENEVGGLLWAVNKRA